MSGITGGGGVNDLVPLQSSQRNGMEREGVAESEDEEKNKSCSKLETDWQIWFDWQHQRYVGWQRGMEGVRDKGWRSRESLARMGGGLEEDVRLEEIKLDFRNGLVLNMKIPPTWKIQQGFRSSFWVSPLTVFVSLAASDSQSSQCMWTNMGKCYWKDPTV